MGTKSKQKRRTVPESGIHPPQGSDKQFAPILKLHQRVKVEVSKNEEILLKNQMRKKIIRIEKDLRKKNIEEKELEKRVTIACKKHIRKKARGRKIKNEILANKMGNNKIKIASKTQKILPMNRE